MSIIKCLSDFLLHHQRPKISTKLRQYYSKKIPSPYPPSLLKISLLSSRYALFSKITMYLLTSTRLSCNLRIDLSIDRTILRRISKRDEKASSFEFPFSWSRAPACKIMRMFEKRRDAESRCITVNQATPGNYLRTCAFVFAKQSEPGRRTCP